MPEAATVEALTKFVSTTGVIGVLLGIIVSLFWKGGKWMPISLHHLVVEQFKQRLEDKDQQLAQRERELERYHQAVLANHGLLTKTVDAIVPTLTPPKGY